MISVRTRGSGLAANANEARPGAAPSVGFVWLARAFSRGWQGDKWWAEGA